MGKLIWKRLIELNDLKIIEIIPPIPKYVGRLIDNGDIKIKVNLDYSLSQFLGDMDRITLENKGTIDGAITKITPNSDGTMWIKIKLSGEWE